MGDDPFFRKKPESVRDAVMSVLKEMETRDPEIEGSVVVRSDGLFIAGALPAEIDRDLVAAMSASIFQVSKKVLEELNRGELRNCVLWAENGVLALCQVTPGIILAAIAKKDANVGLMLVEMRRAAEKLREILK